jgi:hypothetical protein
MANTKLFGEKRYTSDGTCSKSEADANKKAEKERANGRNARVAKDGDCYKVYTRKPAAVSGKAKSGKAKSGVGKKSKPRTSKKK